MLLHRSFAILLLAFTSAAAQPPVPPPPPPSDRAALRFPQPVRIGDLIGREVLRPVEAQNVLGRVASLVRRPDGAILVVINIGGVLGVGSRPVAVPVGAVALLGQYVAAMDITPKQLQILPTFDPAGTAPLAPDDIIRVGIVRPFH